jgi:hypothetical protein
LDVTRMLEWPSLFDNRSGGKPPFSIHDETCSCLLPCDLIPGGPVPIGGGACRPCGSRSPVSPAPEPGQAGGDIPPAIGGASACPPEGTCQLNLNAPVGEDAVRVLQHASGPGPTKGVGGDRAKATDR